MTDVPPEAPAEEYEPEESTAAVSPDTGTVYEGEGEPASTPHDVETEEEP